VQVRDLVKHYRLGSAEVPALRGVSFDIEAGKLVSIMGPSGSGTSTLLHLMGGLDTPTSGSVIIDGSDLAKLGDEDLTLFRRRSLGFIFQFFNLLPTMSAWENVALPRLATARQSARQNLRQGRPIPCYPIIVPGDDGPYPPTASTSLNAEHRAVPRCRLSISLQNRPAAYQGRPLTPGRSLSHGTVPRGCAARL